MTGKIARCPALLVTNPIAVSMMAKPDDLLRLMVPEVAFPARGPR
jgi:hypothetical protein